ncbi:MAG TPA: RCC1 domain-containing protein, partial [Kofleriaceae bacterium]|nr:RCC1 domain-containing protein [Kofleriaceae bacterium]
AGVQPVTLPGVTQIVAGTDHTCALAGPDVYCWGQRFAASPTKVNLGAGAIAVAAGSGHDCAILADGTVRCWGANGFGQLGNNSTTGSTTPVQAVVCP